MGRLFGIHVFPYPNVKLTLMVKFKFAGTAVPATLPTNVLSGHGIGLLESFYFSSYSFGVLKTQLFI